MQTQTQRQQLPQTLTFLRRPARQVTVTMKTHVISSWRMKIFAQNQNLSREMILSHLTKDLTGKGKRNRPKVPTVIQNPVSSLEPQ